MKTQWINIFSFVLLSSLLTGCYPSKPELPPVVATIGTGGSLDGAYSLRLMQVRDTRGGGSGFGYGAVNGYPGASATIGIGVPISIEGEWAKKSTDRSEYTGYYRISAQIDAELARQKIETLQNYYQNFQYDDGVMRVVVEGPRVRLFYATSCYPHRMDCTPKENADPNGWVVSSPVGTNVVVLFDGVGETSTTPFPGSSFDK